MLLGGITRRGVGDAIPLVLGVVDMACLRRRLDDGDMSEVSTDVSIFAALPFALSLPEVRLDTAASSASSSISIDSGWRFCSSPLEIPLVTSWVSPLARDIWEVFGDLVSS